MHKEPTRIAPMSQWRARSEQRLADQNLFNEVCEAEGAVDLADSNLPECKRVLPQLGIVDTRSHAHVIAVVHAHELVLCLPTTSGLRR
jgi:hypothetical protein